MAGPGGGLAPWMNQSCEDWFSSTTQRLPGPTSTMGGAGGKEARVLAVGVDWAEEFHDIALGSAEEGVVEQFRIEHGPVLFIGDDWAEDHHDVELADERGCPLEFLGWARGERRAGSGGGGRGVGGGEQRGPGAGAGPVRGQVQDQPAGWFATDHAGTTR